MVMNTTSRSALFVAYHYPPICSAGVTRSVSFIHYLREFGYSCQVLTTSAFGGSDGALRAWEPIAFYRWLFNREVRGGILDSKNRTRRGFFSRVLRKLLIPDVQVFWIPIAFFRGLHHIKTRKCDLIYSSFPPASGHLVAFLLHRYTGLPWTADFRDSWIFDPLDTELLKSKWRLALERYLENKVISNATVIVVATEEIAKALRGTYPSCSAKINVIYNGFDSRIAPDSKVKLENDVLFLVHTGSFSYSHAQRTPTQLFNALNMLLEEDSIWLKRIRVVLAGALSAEEKSAAAALVKVGIVRLEGVVDSDEVRTLQRMANVLLLIDHVRPWPSTNIPGKFFEYLAMRKPILSIGGDGAVQNLMWRLKAGRHVAGQDPEEILIALKEFYFAGKHGTLACQTDEAEIAQFHRRKETQQLANCFDKAIESLCCQ
tara:strand:- start:185 stop:1477 length:1293 start_codon:yes stop_codon:yes gene_type:complete